jgi:spermidine/putrescine transport system substrate-binding protein
MTQPDPRSAPFVRGALTRRDVLRRAAAVGGLLATGNVLAACGGGTVGGAKSQAPASSAAGIDKTIAPNWTFANWPEYIDVERKTHHKSLELFDAKYKTKTRYVEPIIDNAEFFGKVQPQLQAGQDIGYDIVVLTDWMASKWIQLGYTQKLDTSLLPNVEANLVDVLRGRTIDPKDEYLVPWQSGLTGIGYNAKLVDKAPTSIKDLWNPKYKGHVTLLTEMRDTFGLVMLSLGIDPSKATEADAQKAYDEIKPHVDSGQVRGFTGNNYIQGMTSGSITIATVWSGDMVQLQADNPNLKFVVPDDGCMIWTDNMMIPNQAAHPYNAHLWMNYYYQPETAAIVEDWVNYICPVDGATDVLLKSDPSVAKNQLIFPPKSTLDKAHVFKALSPEEDQKFNELFQQLQGG